MASASAPPDPTIAEAGLYEAAGTTVTGFAKVLASRYEIVGLLGSGGMGTVYRARDIELDEIVALKVLKKELAQAPEMLGRFRREVKLARKVTHVNVARTFDIGEDGGDRFLTMEYVEGDPLSAILAREQRLPLDRVVPIAAAILDGLAASHDAGVVHGDLKPENVICARSGRVVITDFGIARALTPDPTSPHTATGMVVGTPAYMAPEQVEGSGTLDGRADLYALGCMLYRLLTGDLPWSGTSLVSLAAARLLRDPPDPTALVRDLPEDVRRVVLTCMARDREQRYASARDASAALLRDKHVRPVAVAATLVSPSAAGSPKSVAVLPVQNQGPAEDAYLAGGLTDDLIDVLCAVPLLRVRPRGAVTAYAGEARDAREAGRALGVDVVIDGSVQRTGEALRATLRLVTVEDGFQLWAQRFERSASAFLSIADEAAAAIAAVLASQKVSRERASPTDATALDLYLRGRYAYSRSYFGVREAVRLLEAAHARAPGDGRIAGAYALASMRQHQIELLPASSGTEKVRALAEAAIASDPSVAEAHVALALVHLDDCEPRSAAKSLVRALAANATNADALDWMGNLLLEIGRPREAIRHLSLARVADANLVVAYTALARAHGLLGDWDACESTLRLMMAHSGDALLPWLLRTRMAIWRGDPAHASRLGEELARAPVPETGREFVGTLLGVARDGTISPEARAFIDAELIPVRVARRSLLNVQLRIEMLCRGGRSDEAKESYAKLDDHAFIDLAWLDLCPALASLRGSREHEATRRGTAARVERIAEVLDAAPLSRTS